MNGDLDQGPLPARSRRARPAPARAPRADPQVGRDGLGGVGTPPANLEYGVGNASILVLQQVAGALDCDLAELVGDVSTSSPEWLMLRESLRGKSEADLRRARIAVSQIFGTGVLDPARGRRIALIGL